MSGLSADRRAFEEQLGPAHTALLITYASLLEEGDLDDAQVAFRDALGTVLAVTGQVRMWVRDSGPAIGREVAPAMATGAALTQDAFARGMVDALMQRNDPEFLGLHLLGGFFGERQSPDEFPGG